MAGRIPVALNLLLCDAVHTDHGTGKRNLLGVFSAINAREFPVQHSQCWMFAELTNGQGETALTISFTRVTAKEPEGERIWAIEITPTFPDLRAVIPLGVQFNGMPIPQPGEYRLAIECNGNILIERRVMAVKLK